MINGRVWRAAFLSAGLLGGCASSVIVDPSWASFPDPEAISERYPAFAAMIGLEGDATLDCVVTADGLLALCRSVSTIPKGVGFDRAALSTTDLYRVNPRQVDGEARKTTVRFTTRFRMGPDSDPEPWSGPEPSPEQLAAAERLVSYIDRITGGDAVLATLPLDVDADREAEVRAMMIEVAQARRDLERRDMVLSFARRFTIEQMNFIVTRRGAPPLPPSDELWEEALMGYDGSMGHARALRARYCARYDCSPPPDGPGGS